MNDIGMLLDLTTLLFPSLYMYLLCIGSGTRSLSLCCVLMVSPTLAQYARLCVVLLQGLQVQHLCTTLLYDPTTLTLLQKVTVKGPRAHCLVWLLVLHSRTTST